MASFEGATTEWSTTDMQFWGHRRDKVDANVRDSGVVAGPPDHRDAFAEGIRQGRREEAARRRGHPMLALVVALIAVAGVAMLALAAKEGSFSRGGQVVDQHISAVAGKAQDASSSAVAQTGQALENAGATIKQKAAGQ